MGRKSRIKRDRRCEQVNAAAAIWEDSTGIHNSFLVPGVPEPGLAAKLTQKFQDKIRNSPLWKQMVDEFGEEEAKKILTKCKAEIK